MCGRMHPQKDFFPYEQHKQLSRARLIRQSMACRFGKHHERLIQRQVIPATGANLVSIKILSWKIFAKFSTPKSKEKQAAQLFVNFRVVYEWPWGVSKWSHDGRMFTCMYAPILVCLESD